MQICMAGPRFSRLDLAREWRDARGMSRRELLRWFAAAAGVALNPACAAPQAISAAPALPQPTSGNPSSGSKKVRAICFDLFTLFDPRSVEGVVAGALTADAKVFTEAWRNRQFQYSFLRAAAGQYRDFESLTEDALLYTAAAQRVSLSVATKKRLVEAYSELELWPDARAMLTEFRRLGLRLAPISNYSPGMLQRLLDRVDITGHFEQLLPTELVRSFKPNPRAYALGTDRLGLGRDEIVFAAFGGWDAAGAKWFGYPTFWVNRLGQTEEVLEPGPDASGPTLAGLADFVRSRG
jgi:2-haloacid dehalogenase